MLKNVFVKGEGYVEFWYLKATPAVTVSSMLYLEAFRKLAFCIIASALQIQAKESSFRINSKQFLTRCKVLFRQGRIQGYI